MSDPLVYEAENLVRDALVILDSRGEAIAAAYLSMALHALRVLPKGVASSQEDYKKRLLDVSSGFKLNRAA